MRKLFFLPLLAALILSGCNPETPGPDPNALQEVIFSSPVLQGGAPLKSDPMSCDNPPADYAAIVISDGVSTETYYPSVFYVNGVMYTQAIKLAPGSYFVSEFVLMQELGDPNDRDDDEAVNAAPHEGSSYGALLSNPLPVYFTVDAFTKIEVEIEILCFEEADFEDFGFVWFRVTEIAIRQMWFFGDFCTKNFEDYATSDYGPDVAVDMPAIFRLDVYRNGDMTGSYTNVGQLTPGPVAIQYVDRPGVTDEFEIKVYILVKVGAGFEMKYFGSWFFNDNGQIDTQNGVGPGVDGVYDFVLGNCNALEADLAFAPYINLPSSGTLIATVPGDPREAYLNINLTFSGTGYDVLSGVQMGGFCFNEEVTIYVNQTYNVDIYSSLNPGSLPAFMQNLEWDRVNWLINHLEEFPGYSWFDLQHAIWSLEDGAWSGAAHGSPGDIGYVPPATTIGLNMYNAAVLNGDGYQPLPGGWGAVTFVNDGAIIQTVFIIVDP